MERGSVSLRLLLATTSQRENDLLLQVFVFCVVFVGCVYGRLR